MSRKKLKKIVQKRKLKFRLIFRQVKFACKIDPDPAAKKRGKSAGKSTVFCPPKTREKRAEKTPEKRAKKTPINRLFFALKKSHKKRHKKTAKKVKIPYVIHNIRKKLIFTFKKEREKKHRKNALF